MAPSQLSQGKTSKKTIALILIIQIQVHFKTIILIVWYLLKSKFLPLIFYSDSSYTRKVLE